MLLPVGRKREQSLEFQRQRTWLVGTAGSQGATSSGWVAVNQGGWRSNASECSRSRKLRDREHTGVCEKIGEVRGKMVGVARGHQRADTLKP